MKHHRSSWVALAACATLGTSACGGGDVSGDPGGGGGAGSNSSGSSSSDSSAGSNSSGSSTGGSMVDPSTPPPTLKPEILLATYIGGAGNQYVRKVSIGDDGTIVAEGKSFTVKYDAAVKMGALSGDANAADPDAYSEKPQLYKQWNNQWTVSNGARKLDDPRNGMTYYMGTQQVSNDLQQPLFLACKMGEACAKEAFEWRLWGWWASLCKDKSLAADSRGYDVWLMPNNLIGVQLWTDGGNSTLGRDPRRTQECTDAATCTTIDTTLESQWSKDTWQSMPNSLSTLYMTIDPAKGEPVKATFLRGAHVTRITHDPWGRLVIPQAVGKAFPTVDPENPFGHSTSARSGLLVLGTDMQAQVNARIGGTCSGDGTLQALPELALKDGILVMGGTTCAQDLKVTDNAVQKTAGGGQDGFLVVVKLW